MYDQNYAESMEYSRSFQQERFIQGHHKYWILKRKENSIIYDGDTEIYAYDEHHNDFLKTISLFNDKFNDLETELKNYYTYASSSDYDFNKALEHLKSIDKSLQKVHVFFNISDYSLIYIRRSLYEYFCKMVERRFLYFFALKVNSGSVIDMHYLEDFRKTDKKFFDNLFQPICHLLLKRNKENLPELSLNHLWGYFQYISHSPNALNAKISENDLKKYCSFDYTKDICLNAEKTPILYHYKILAGVFIDYFSFFSNMQSYYPKTKTFHQYLLILSNNHLYTKLIDSCTFYSKYHSMHTLIENHIVKTNPHYIRINSQIAQDFTNDIYQYIQDHATDEEEKEGITQEILYFYPEEFEKKMDAEIIEFQFFEQLFAIELLDIISQNIIIKKCPTCNEYFITNSKKQKRCEKHKGDPAGYKTPKEKESSYMSTLHRYNECFRKRKRLNKITQKEYNAWKSDSDKLISEAESKNFSIDEFTDKLNSICKNNGILPPRKYNN